jgi:hypothetical protein
MSLISDALKKARQEAARQDSLRQTLPYAVGSADPPAQRNLYMPLLAGLGAGCVLAVVVFGILYLGGWGPFSRTRKDAVQIAETPSPVAAPRTAPSAEPAPAPPVIEERAEERSQPAPPTPAQEPRPKPMPVQTVPPVAETPLPRSQPAPVPEQEARLAPPPAPTPPPVPTVAAPIRAPAPPAPAASNGGPEDGKAYVNEVPVPGGGVVKLNGIAFSPDHPIAVLDGRVVAPGEVVQGFTVLEIQADHVTLQGHGAKVSVSLK